MRCWRCTRYSSILEIAGLTLYDGKQADAALGNPIHLEALLLGALALILGRTCRAPRRWAAAVVLLALGLELTFERLAIVVLIGLVLYALYSYGVRRGGIFALLVAAGYAIGYLTHGSGLSARVVSGTSETTFGTRLRIWWEGAHYVVHHLLLGAGPGQARTAFDSTATLSFFQHVLVGRVLTDSHDLFVEVAVTTGLVGLVCFLVWLFGAVRVAARGGFLGFAAAVVAVNLVEPLNVAVLPLAFLALGAATAACSPEGSLAAVAVPRAGVASRLARGSHLHKITPSGSLGRCLDIRHVGGCSDRRRDDDHRRRLYGTARRTIVRASCSTSALRRAATDSCPTGPTLRSWWRRSKRTRASLRLPAVRRL